MENNFFEKHKDAIFTLCNTTILTSDGKPTRPDLVKAMRMYLAANGVTNAIVEAQGKGTFDEQWSEFRSAYNGVKGK